MEKSQQRTDTIEVAYWECNIPRHRHQREDTANKCIALGKRTVTKNRWTDELCEECLARYDSGASWAAIGRSLPHPVGGTIVRNMVFGYLADQKRTTLDWIERYALARARLKRTKCQPANPPK